MCLTFLPQFISNFKQLSLPKEENLASVSGNGIVFRQSMTNTAAPASPTPSGVLLEWAALPGKAGELAFLTLSRPEASNAFDAAMVDGIERALEEVRAKQSGCRALILRGQGKNFCAGADLGWMKASAELSEAENLAEARKLTKFYDGFYRLPVPTIAVVQGACYGGGVGLAAACDWVIAQPSARFCLSEVKLGVVAAVILPYLVQKIPTSALRRLVLTASLFGADEALRLGLVQRIAGPDAESVLREELRDLLAGAPDAQKVFKGLHQRVVEGEFANQDELQKTLAQTIATMRASPSGRHGLACFVDKKVPNWSVTLPENFRLSKE